MPDAPVDSFGRSFSYLRLSVTEACNFRCLYCLPEGYQKSAGDPPLSIAEIRRLARGFVSMGFWKFRLTGGEATTRRDIVEIASAVAEIPGVRKLCLSTNGYRLLELARPLKEAGVCSINVSVDSLIPERFARITGQDRLPAILSGIRLALDLGLETKINVVMLQGLNDAEISDFLSWTRNFPVTVRFIELMRTGDNADLFGERHLSAGAVLSVLRGRGWSEEARRPGAGPALIFRRPGHKGSAGVIAPYSQEFCQNCNRLRVTSRGALRLCLFAETDHSLRPWLQEDGQIEELKERIVSLLGLKKISHDLPAGRFGNARHLAMMGG